MAAGWVVLTSRHSDFGAADPAVGGGKMLGVRRYPLYMSYLLYDFLLPVIGPAAAEYWAQLLVVGPL
ncbi:hypothetical protein [Nocardia sp. XZ_19_369]|uniref:hypothetical protein n=1 Tax=Nocardia sp. XZ_19_369 TaxID=2769487 RepID=UPI00189081EC|nr:hypothetical protein [Nocardia sp. XZ_19_369]